jgi:ATP-dependent DNA helicase RecQ
LAIRDWDLGVLSFGARSGEGLKGTIPLTLSKRAIQWATTTGAREESKESKPVLHGEAGELLQALKDLRRKLADAEKIPAYLVFNDKTLIDMTYLRPQSFSDFLLVHGVGEKKRELYGSVFLDVIRKFQTSENQNQMGIKGESYGPEMEQH